ncbi:hypothetical protein Tco_0132482 [Tanacetum coccineum]
MVANSTTEAEYVAASSCYGQAKTINGEVQLHAIVDEKKIIINESTVRRDLQLEDVEATNQKFNFSKYIFESMVKNLDNVSRKFLMYPRFSIPTDPHHTPTIIESSTQPQKTQKPRKPKRKDTQVPQPSGPTNIVIDEAIHKELGDSLVRAATIDSSLEAEQDSEVAAKDVNLTIDEVTLAQALAALKSVKPKVKRDVIEEPNVPVNAASASTKVSAATTTTATIPTPRKGIFITKLGAPTITRSSQQPSQAEVQDKGKWKMIEPEPVKKMSKKDQLRSDEEEAKILQAKFDEEERLAREKDKASFALTKE